ncbi:MAG: RrF2 family transcriptional regulator [Planctomycetota bacterium]
MPASFNVSEAVSLAMHGMAFIAAHPDERWARKDIAERLRVSDGHLAKILARLVSAGLLDASPGKGGGFVLARQARKIRLIEVYEAVEGPVPKRDCLFKIPVCKGKKCILGGLLPSMDRQIRNYLSKTRLSDIVDIYGGKK